MFFLQKEIGSFENYAYIIGSELSKEAWVVDPGSGVLPLLLEAKEAGYSVTSAILTHGHPDHVGGLGVCLEAGVRTVLVHERERVTLPEGLVRRKVRDQEVLRLGNIEVEVIHTPGHTSGGICLLVRGHDGEGCCGKACPVPCLLSGDTLFIECCGSVSFGGSIEDMYDSLSERIMPLPDETRVYPGHSTYGGPWALLGDIRETNSALKELGDRGKFVEMFRNW